MASVSNPVTGEFHSERDSDGTPIPQKDGGPNCRYVVKTIVRFKTITGQEFLYSLGELRGFNALGEPVVRAIRQPEVYTRTKFATERRYDNQTRNLYETVKGVRGNETVYEMPFSPENVQSIFDKVDQHATTNKIPVEFIVKDEATGTAISVNWSSIKDTLNLFKNKSFAYLFNGDYIPAPVKAESLARSKALLQQQIGGGQQGQGGPQQIPDIPKIDDNNNNSKSYTLTSNYDNENYIIEDGQDKGVLKYHDKNISYVG